MAAEAIRDETLEPRSRGTGLAPGQMKELIRSVIRSAALATFGVERLVQGSLGGDSKRRTATYARHVARSPFMLHACNVHCDRARDLIWNGRVCDGKSTVGIEKLEPVRTGPHAIRIHVLYLVWSRGDGLSSVGRRGPVCDYCGGTESNSQE